MDGRHELTRRETQEDAWREIMLPDAGAELEVRMEHGTKGQRYRLELYLVRLRRACLMSAHLKIYVSGRHQIRVVWSYFGAILQVLQLKAYPACETISAMNHTG